MTAGADMGAGRPTGSRVLICGGRDFDDYAYMDRVLRLIDHWPKYGPIRAIIHGGARGADTLAGQWATNCGLAAWSPDALVVYPADWDRHGLAAGPIRNQQMLDEGNPDLVIAFHGGSGTADMIRRAKAAGVKVFEMRGRLPTPSPAEPQP